MRRVQRRLARIACVGIMGTAGLWGTPPASADPDRSPVVTWSREAQRAVVPPGPNGVFGVDNYGTKFPGEAAVYLGIVHIAIHDAAVAVEGRYPPYLVHLSAPTASSAAAVATAAHDVLLGLQPALGISATTQAALDSRYADYLAALPDDSARALGVGLGRQVSEAVLAWRHDDGRDQNPPYTAPPSGPGVWSPGAAAPLGVRLPGIRPLALDSVSQFRPGPPPKLTSRRYLDDLSETQSLGRSDSGTRSAAQTETALFWTDHDLRQWNDALLRLAIGRGLDLVDTARLLAMAHVSGGDAMLACFDAKYTYSFWRPFQAIAPTDPSWTPLRPTPNFPEYPSAHACHSSAVVTAIQSFFGSKSVALTIDSRITGTQHTYQALSEVVEEVNNARVLAGFHFRNSDEQGAALGRKVARFDTHHFFAH